jgi:hypothetical protein
LEEWLSVCRRIQERSEARERQVEEQQGTLMQQLRGRILAGQEAGLRGVPLGEWQCVQRGVQGGREGRLRRNEVDRRVSLLRYLVKRDPARHGQDGVPGRQCQGGAIRIQCLHGRGTDAIANQQQLIAHHSQHTK